MALTTAGQSTLSIHSTKTLIISSMTGTNTSWAKAPKRISTGSNALPRVCCTLANCSARMICCPAKVSTAASALPLNCVSSSPRMTLCAPAMSPASTMLSIMAFCSSVNCTPALLSAPTPATGSLSALPTCIALLCKSVPSAWLMSMIACVAPPKFSPRIWVNVASTFCAPRIASSAKSDMPDDALIDSAMLAISLAVSPAASPVDLTTASVWAKTD